MLTIEQLIDIVHKETNIDKDIVDDICKFVFRYTSNTMKNKNNKLDILFNNLFKFKLKSRFKNEENFKYR